MLVSGARGTTADDDSLSGWHVRESGHPDSPSVVLLHGAGLSGAMWAEHMARLAPTFHCLAPDFPGCGLSNRRSWTSVGDAADRVAALIDARVPARRAHIVGISLGGAVAHTLVARHPGLVGRLLIDGAGVLPSWRNLPLLIGIAAISPFLHTRPVIAAMSRSVGRMPAAVQSDLLVASRAAFRRAFAEALGTRASRTEVDAECPTLLVAGELEAVVRQSNAALAALMPSAAARYVPRLGHGWLGTRLDLHVEMTAAWLANEPLPLDLLVERPWPGAVERLRRQLERGQ